MAISDSVKIRYLFSSPNQREDCIDHILISHSSQKISRIMYFMNILTYCRNCANITLDTVGENTQNIQGD